MTVRPIPEGFHTVTPYLVVSDPALLIDFLKAAFDAQEIERSVEASGRVAHAQVRVGNSMVMMGGATEKHPPQPSMLYLYVQDTEATYRAAMQAGGESLMKPTLQFYGDLNAAVLDPCGNQWWIATHVEDVSPEEIAKRMKARK
ncbi:MAG: VOC family protein [bacterium]